MNQQQQSLWDQGKEVLAVMYGSLTVDPGEEQEATLYPGFVHGHTSINEPIAYEVLEVPVIDVYYPEVTHWYYIVRQPLQGEETHMTVDGQSRFVETTSQADSCTMSREACERELIELKACLLYEEHLGQL